MPGTSHFKLSTRSTLISLSLPLFALMAARTLSWLRGRATARDRPLPLHLLKQKVVYSVVNLERHSSPEEASAYLRWLLSHLSNPDSAIRQAINTMEET